MTEARDIYRKHDNQWIGKTFKLCSEDEVNQDQGKNKGYLHLIKYKLFYRYPVKSGF